MTSETSSGIEEKVEARRDALISAAILYAKYLLIHVHDADTHNIRSGGSSAVSTDHYTALKCDRHDGGLSYQRNPKR
jgi:hypothetical protein